MLIDEGLGLLTEEEALELLASAEVGRVGVTIGALPAIFPVNYRLIDGAVVFRTGVGSKLRAASSGNVVAFEADDHDPVDRTGWSVLLIGQAEVVHDPELEERLQDVHLEPFAGGDRSALVRVEPTFVSGRRIVTERT
jgi:nitroimidazol reductase NimA-like FMN-containing flavoprotein (pyridoxamine 5'-phosphate oxidase superfamily)